MGNNNLELEIYTQYQDIISPLILELEIRDGEFPVEILNEIRSIFTHLARYKMDNNRQDELVTAERHVRRAIRDCFKYMCISIDDEIKEFKHDYKHVDFSKGDNGNFQPALNSKIKGAKSSLLKARTAETKNSSSDDEIYSLFESAYHDYNSVLNFIDSSSETISFCSSESKRNNTLIIISFVVGIIGLLIGIFT